MSVSFKEALAHDAEAVFLNLDEFGEEVDIDGLTVPAVKGNTFSFAARSATSGSTSTGFTGGAMQPELPLCDLVLHVRTADIPENIIFGGVVTVDGTQYFVAERHDGLGGMTRLDLARSGF